jgi:hypothetical protein
MVLGGRPLKGAMNNLFWFWTGFTGYHGSFCISPFPDGREKIQSSLTAGKEPLNSHY